MPFTVEASSITVDSNRLCFVAEGVGGELSVYRLSLKLKVFSSFEIGSVQQC